MSLLRRLLRRPGAMLPTAAHLALDIGTEYAKALVFELADSAGASVIGVGRRRQGLAHMQSGTVADIPAVVRNCREALDEASEMAGRQASKVVIGIAGELVKGFTTTLTVGGRAGYNVANLAAAHLGAGDASRARELLGWRPTVGFRELVGMMVEHDLTLLREGGRR